MQVGEETIKWHMKNLFAKLDAGTRKQVVRRARRMLGCSRGRLSSEPGASRSANGPHAVRAVTRVLPLCDGGLRPSSLICAMRCDARTVDQRRRRHMTTDTPAAAPQPAVVSAQSLATSIRSSR